MKSKFIYLVGERDRNKNMRTFSWFFHVVADNAIHISVILRRSRAGNTHTYINLKMEAIYSSETSVLSRAIRHHILEDNLLH
jgi:hypothetical protein